jgi:hypothetical protein
MKKTPFVLHPILFAVFPAISLVSDHVRFLSINSTILGMASITIVICIIFLFLLRLVGIGSQKAGIIVSLALLLFFSYGHVFYFISKTFTTIDFRYSYLLFAWGISGFSLVYLTIRTKKNLSTHTTFLNIAGAFMVTLSLAQIASYEISVRNVWKPARDIEGYTTRSTDSSGNPDIYYLIFDTYANESTLREFYNFDNAEFTNYLQDRGFFVAEESYSNYAMTTLSLASSLNMDYLDTLSPNLGENDRDWDYEVPTQMIENNSVLWFLKSKGYAFIFLGSGNGITQRNRYADQEIKCGVIDETLERIIQSTLIWPFSDRFQFMERDGRAKRLCMFEKLAEVPGVKSPKFVFAHIPAPHFPFLFDANGDPVREYLPGREHMKEYYINQLIFLNKKIKGMVDEILSKSKVEPIIVLQADTGPQYGFEPEERVNNPNDGIYQQSMRILNAYHLPQNGARWLYKGISPVNTFRLIFSNYFDADIPLLDDQSYFSTADFPYRFINVTESVDYH